MSCGISPDLILRRTRVLDFAKVLMAEPWLAYN